ncbi:polymer-forming cytoskeletal protein [Proteiniphilum sp. UBA5510]|jgi:cytoskeletal protein CcmA (bactofilin family)|uniref:polymer-forming cytoskeletal protein n=1 Tax=Proteiniphilum sp. UBA5510 TaxID=1947286 RepID=UPI0039C90266
MGEKAAVNRTLESDQLIICGNITGIIRSKEFILKSTESAQADIFSDFLQVEKGSRYNGSLKIGQQEKRNMEHA